MNINAVTLGYILKQIPDYKNNFSMSEFDDRLKLQKTIYLLQLSGIYLGYNFSWYLRGPYCSLLTTNGFELKDIYNEIPNNKIEFQKKEKQKRFKNFLKFIDNMKKMNAKYEDVLEAAASLHYLKNNKKHDDKTAKEMVNTKCSNINTEQIENIWKEMEKCQLI
jgi:uncharacterized protein YwgA